MELHISSPEAMYLLGHELAKEHSHFLLSGALGAGKTTLTKGIAEGLGIDPNRITSPTYAYTNTYDEKLLHIDMRRIETPEYLWESGLIELIDLYPFVIIERPKWTQHYANPTRTNITLHKEEHGRKITVNTWAPTVGQELHPSINQ